MYKYFHQNFSKTLPLTYYYKSSPCFPKKYIPIVVLLRNSNLRKSQQTSSLFSRTHFAFWKNCVSLLASARAIVVFLMNSFDTYAGKFLQSRLLGYYKTKTKMLLRLFVMFCTLKRIGTLHHARMKHWKQNIILFIRHDIAEYNN